MVVRLTAQGYRDGLIEDPLLIFVTLFVLNPLQTDEVGQTDLNENVNLVADGNVIVGQ